MPELRQSLLRSLWVIYSHGFRTHVHTHDWHQLIYASTGLLHVRVEDRHWVVPPNRALWIPAGVAHQLTAHGESTLRTLYFPQSTTTECARCQVMPVSPLLRELILHATSIGILYDDSPQHARLAGVISDQLHGLEALPLELAMPQDPRALRLTEEIRKRPQASLDSLSRRVGAAKRTLERIFLADTGITLGRWRQQHRLLESMKHLAAGLSVQETAAQVGYESTGAFITAFRMSFGVTPRRYADSEDLG